MKKMREDIKTIHHKKSSWPKKQRPKANRPQPQISNARIMPIMSARRALGSYRKKSFYRKDWHLLKRVLATMLMGEHSMSVSRFKVI